MGLSLTDIFAPFSLEKATGVIAAVSGGSDSLGLLFLLKGYLATLSQPPALTAVTVDHQLRPESAQEAEDVALLCQQYGIAHRIMVWDNKKPLSGVAAAARSARYRLLVQAANEAGADLIMTGHTQNDQIETFLMRKARSSHAEARGLASMATCSRIERSVQLIRPLLNVARQDLRSELSQRGIAWVDDPSNVNMNYERPQIRFGAASTENTARIAAEITLAATARKRDNAALVSVLDASGCLRMEETGALILDAAIYAALPYNLRLLLAAILVALAGGRRFLPGESERIRIERILSDAEASSRSTVFGTLIERGAERQAHRFQRERRNLPAEILKSGESIVWDGRFRIANAGQASVLVKAPQRQELLDFLKASHLDVTGKKKEALLVLPAIYCEGQLLACPLLNGADGDENYPLERHFALFDHVLPGYDFCLAQAFEKSLGRHCSRIS